MTARDLKPGDVLALPNGELTIFGDPVIDPENPDHVEIPARVGILMDEVLVGHTDMEPLVTWTGTRPIPPTITVTRAGVRIWPEGEGS